MKIQDARAVVTGGASGLGNAVAQYVASKGGKVAILDVQEGPGRAAAATALGANAQFIRCDVTSEAEVNAAMESANAFMGSLNLLVNCAGVVGAGRVLGKNGPMAGDFFAKVVHINLIGTFLCDKGGGGDHAEQCAHRGRRARASHPHLFGRRVRGPDWPGRLFRHEGGPRWHDTAHRT